MEIKINLQNKPHLCLNKPVTAMKVTNDAKVIKMTIKAEGCNCDNEGRCLHTMKSQSQLQFPQEQRDQPGSAPVSYHIIGSEAGANAGVDFGNSVVASEHYNKLERVVSDVLKKYVGDQDFVCIATVELEELAQSKAEIKQC